VQALRSRGGGGGGGGANTKSGAAAAAALPPQVQVPTPTAPPASSASSGDNECNLRRAFDGYDPADDCETPLVAYQHVAPLLAKLAQRLKKKPHELIIWDPYFCDGAVARHLTTLG